MTSKTKEHKVCPNCGYELSAYSRWERLSPGIVNCLWKLARAVGEKGVNRVHLANDLDLSKSEYNNAQKLRYFGLIAKLTGYSGYWLLTTNGGRFLSGKINVSRKVKIYENTIVEHSVETVNIKEYYHKFPWFETRFDCEVVNGNVFERICQDTLL